VAGLWQESDMDKNHDQNARIATQILSRKTLARGVFVLDENLFGLGPALRDANTKVVQLAAAWSDAEVKESLLPHRVMVTSNPHAFVDDAPVYEYGVVTLGKLKSIDTSPSYRTNRTVQLLLKAMSQYGLWAKGAKFLLELRDDGSHVLSDLS
jgi:hypothetical protein